jgi:hypothetical protein
VFVPRLKRRGDRLVVDIFTQEAIVAGEGTFLDVQELAQKAFDRAKDNIDNPVYEIESAWKSGFMNGWRSAIKTAEISEQEALDKLHTSQQ